MNFNSHAHVERDYVRCAVGARFVYFNSHAHVERDTLKWEIALLARISTHTLTWSVTNIIKIVLTRLTISTHTLTWSVTNFTYIIQIVRKNFNSHAHVERDELLLKSVITFYHFNSHAHVERDHYKKIT